jgi:hypothetical protein
MLPPPSPSSKTITQQTSPTSVTHHSLANGQSPAFNAQQITRHLSVTGQQPHHTDPSSPASPAPRARPAQHLQAWTHELSIKKNLDSTDQNQVDQTDDTEKPCKSESLNPPTPTKSTQQPSHAHTTEDLSFHEEDTLLSSPSSTRASSPKAHNVSGHNATDVFTKLLDMGDEVERKVFVDRLQSIWEEYNIQCRSLPNISKSPLDLFKLYCAVQEKAGFNEVTRLKLWKEVSNALLNGPSATAAFNVKKKFVQLGLFHLECKFDRGGIDPLPLIADIEKPTTKKTPSANSNGNTSKSKIAFETLCRNFLDEICESPCSFGNL